MSPASSVIIDSPLPGGIRLGLGFVARRLAVIDFRGPDTPLRLESAPELEAVLAVLQQYFSAPRQVQALPPLAPQGTPFQQRVWQALRGIPVGDTKTYGELARELNTSARALAGACRANPIPLLIPCHRVVAAHGPGGYMGQRDGEALAIKQWLLHHERHAG